MPTISVFFGITVRMYYDDHPPAHVHAYYGGDVALIDIQTLRVLQGRLPRRALALVLEWAELHQEELTDNWARAERHESLNRIDPLD